MKAARRQSCVTATLGLALVILPAIASAQDTPTLQKSRDTRIGRIELDHGFPSKGAVSKLFNEIDFQRACQAYMWGLPIVGFAEWQKTAAKNLGAGNLDYVIYLSVRDKLGILTPNATTPYILTFPNLAETGALVVELPPGPTAGGVRLLATADH